MSSVAVRDLQALHRSSNKYPDACPVSLKKICRPLPRPFVGPALSHRTQRSSARHQKRFAVTASAATAPPKPEEQKKQEEIGVDGVVPVKISNSVTCLMGICKQRFKFEIEYGLKRGTTDNCYLIRERDGEGTVLVDVPDQAFADNFIKALESVAELRSVSRIVLTHLTPKRMNSLKDLLAARQSRGSKTAKPLDVHLSNPALQLLRSTLGESEDGAALLSSINPVVAKSGSVISLDGSGASLRVIPTPTPRWPDLLCVYSPRDRVLFTSKLFAAHVAMDPGGSGAPFDAGGWGAFGNDWRHYFDCMLAPVASQAVGHLERLESAIVPAGQSSGPLSSILASVQRGMQSARDRLEAGQAAAFGQASMGIRRSTAALGMTVGLLAPLHGPIVRQSVSELLVNYAAWAAEQVANATRCRAAVLYASAYGNTAALAQAISRGVTRAGVGVETVNLENAEPEEVARVLEGSAGFVIGSPTLGGHMPTQVQTALGTILKNPECRELPCGVFGSFGWSGEAVDEMESRLKDAGFSFAFPAIRVKFKPTARDLQLCEESGTDLGQALKKRMKKAQKNATAPPKGAAGGREQAVGRVLGALCVLTAREDDATSAMLASWVSQASFDPPGLSVAVKRDRAVDNLLPVGNRFVLNVLAEGRDKEIVKQLCKPFKPAEDRFAGLETRESEATGAVILPQAASYLECTVKERMEAGDHWVLYATVDDGKVLTEGVNSAVHHRKIGTTY